MLAGHRFLVKATIGRDSESEKFWYDIWTFASVQEFNAKTVILQFIDGIYVLEVLFVTATPPQFKGQKAKW